MRRGYGYCRVSTAEQVDGESLAVQEAKVRALAVMHNVELVAIFVEGGVSGNKPLRDRPEGRKLWAAVKPGEAILASRLDRTFRNQGDAIATLEACKASRVSLILGDLGGDCTVGAVASMIFGVMSSCSNFERSRLIERIVDAKRAQRARNLYLGGSRPFGFHVVERDGERYLEPDTALQARVRDLRAREFSLRQIAAELAMDGTPACAAAVGKFLRTQVAA